MIPGSFAPTANKSTVHNTWKKRPSVSGIAYLFCYHWSLWKFYQDWLTGATNALNNIRGTFIREKVIIIADGL